MGIAQIVDKGEDIIHTVANPCVIQVFGQTLDEFLNKSLSQTGISQQDIRSYVGKVRQSQQQKQPSNFEMWRDLPMGRRCLSATISHILGDHFAYIFQDITEQKQIEDVLQKNKLKLENMVKTRTKELEIAMQVKSRFLANMSHEIRTPLSGILGMMTLINDSCSTIPNVKDMVHTAQVCGEQLLFLINDILDLTKMEEHVLLLKSAPFSMKKVLEESLDVVSFQKRDNIEIILDLEPDLDDLVIGDAYRFRQVVVNLLSNAIKFSKDEPFKGEVILRAFPFAHYDNGCVEIVISVEDQGIGIPESSMGTLFEPFNQVDNSVTRKYCGTGLGLSISKHLTELMAGKLWATSVENEGSTFYFAVKLMKGHNSENFAVREPTEYTKGKKVLIVDECKTLLDILTRDLASYQLEVFTAQSIFQARNLLAGNSDTFRLAIVDSKIDLNTLIPLLKAKEIPHAIMGYQAIKEEMNLPSISKSNSDRNPSLSPGLPNNFFLKKPIKQSELHQFLITCFSQDFLKTPTCSKVETPIPTLPVPEHPTKKIQILLAEDNLLNQKVISHLLQSIGYPSITIVENGKKAVEACFAQSFHVILMDIMMPELSGNDATKIIRTSLPSSVQPWIIALTANAFPEDKQKSFDAGVDYFLTKPINRNELAETLRKVESHRRDQAPPTGQLTITREQ